MLLLEKGCRVSDEIELEARIFVGLKPLGAVDVLETSDLSRTIGTAGGIARP
jgi:hypothetical protein